MDDEKFEITKECISSLISVIRDGLDNMNNDLSTAISYLRSVSTDIENFENTLLDLDLEIGKIDCDDNDEK